jgi:hypothetical protein
MSTSEPANVWPDLPFTQLLPTAETLRLFSQIVGKVRMARTPWINHSWHVTLRVSARGLLTPLIPGAGGALSLEFDFIDHQLVIRTTEGGERRVALADQSVARFYAETMAALAALGAATEIDPIPSERPNPIAFPDDTAPAAYDPAMAAAFWRALVQIERVFLRFRSAFIGKNSPIQLFWGSFDLAVTRFSGRHAPLHPGGVPNMPDAVAQEADSHEESSAGFWPGGGGVQTPAFYSYAYPAPEGFSAAKVLPATAYYDTALGEFLLPYDAVRTAPDPDAALLAFLQSTYEAAANLAGWDRAALECAEGQIGRPRAVPRSA